MSGTEWLVFAVGVAGLLLIIISIVMLTQVTPNVKGGIVVLLYGIILFSMPTIYSESVLQGHRQILSGEVEYELFTHSDSTRTWERIK